MSVIRVAVRTLCEFTARRGSLDLLYRPAPTAAEGIAGHATLTKQRGPDYQAEYSLNAECEGLLLSGRADGFDPKVGLLEEIKTHRGDLQRISDDQRALHWAQLRAYGAMLCATTHRHSIQLRLTYYDINSKRETTFDDCAEQESLWEELRELCRRYLEWAKQEEQHRDKRQGRLAELRFAFNDFRRGQRELAEATYKATMQGRPLLLQAPTGIGKTLGTLYPALMAMPRSNLDKIYILTARNTTRRVALDGMASLLNAQSETIPLRTLELTAKAQACEYPDRACHGDACPLANGFYDRLPAARQTAVDHSGLLDRAALREIALSHTICPYFLAQELTRWADVIVADVNHYFDQFALLYAVSQHDKLRIAVLIDEAHNLIDRARGMYSTTLQQQTLLTAKRTAPNALKKALQKLSRQWTNCLCENNFSEVENSKTNSKTNSANNHWLAQPPAALLVILNATVATISDYFTDHPPTLALQELFFECLGFMRLAETFAEHSLCELSRDGRGKAILAIHNLIPADFLTTRFNAAHSIVLYSATLTPIEYHRDLLGLPSNCSYLEVTTPFHRDQLCVSVAAVNTRYQKRDASIAPISELIATQYNTAPGNYLAYFSSFRYLQLVCDYFATHFSDIPLWRQSPGMSTQAREAFIAQFTCEGKGIGFAVLGGAFAEGVDLPGTRLIGAFIATLGLPPFDDFHAQLRSRIEQRFGRQQGYNYTFLYPGLQKVIQAAGRVIRSHSDTGTVALIDDRFAQREIKTLLPQWWQIDAPNNRTPRAPYDAFTFRE